ncbi:MAG: hypothetical protein IJL97_03850 [Lachnospiraceae bacterium]|nr:hypothetical protein [Clostridia bacterium]MBR0085665.1 hypothetical protein [Lachnospiraceae bacterium]
MEWIGRPPYGTLCQIQTKDGTYKAKLIRTNKYSGKKDVWRREDEVPRKQRYIKPRDVIVWEQL